MDYLRILWDDPDDREGNVQHVLEHGLSIEDVEEVLENPTTVGQSASTGRPCAWGYTLVAALPSAEVSERDAAVALQERHEELDVAAAWAGVPGVGLDRVEQCTQDADEVVATDRPLVVE